MAAASRVVWLDAHGDLNTPETSPSGNLWGMPFRMILDGGAVATTDVALVGARNLDPGEAEFVAENGIDDSLDRALDGVDRVYLALDVDVLDPSEIDVLIARAGRPDARGGRGGRRGGRAPCPGRGCRHHRDRGGRSRRSRRRAAAGSRGSLDPA